MQPGWWQRIPERHISSVIELFGNSKRFESSSRAGPKIEGFVNVRSWKNRKYPYVPKQWDRLGNVRECYHGTARDALARTGRTVRGAQAVWGNRLVLVVGDLSVLGRDRICRRRRPIVLRHLGACSIPQGTATREVVCRPK